VDDLLGREAGEFILLRLTLKPWQAKSMAAARTAREQITANRLNSKYSTKPTKLLY
jgi:hypothetical protein